jgi:hypothetical protein
MQAKAEVSKEEERDTKGGEVVRLYPRRDFIFHSGCNSSWPA